MGISNSKIGMVFAIEGIFLGMTSLVAGLLLGILLSKLFIMALAKVALLEVTVEFSIPIRAVIEVIITFTTIFLILSVNNFISVARSRLIDLISDAKKKEGMPRYRIIRGILAVIFIGMGYYLSNKVLDKGKFIILSSLVVILVVVGTYTSPCCK